MDFETFIQSLLSLVKSGDNLYYVLYALLTCGLTQIVKKIFVSKVKVDVLHKFDIAVILPFLFGTAFAAIDLVFAKKTPFSFDFVTNLFVTATTVGALATVIFKFVSSLSGQSLKGLMKNDLFGVFYTQLLYFGNVREQLLSKQLAMKDFVSQVKLLSANALKIYQTEDTLEVKKDKLFRLLEGIVARESISCCVEVLNSALAAVVEPSKMEATN